MDSNSSDFKIKFTNLKLGADDLEKAINHKEPEVVIATMISILQGTKTFEEKDWEGDNVVNDKLIELIRLCMVHRDIVVRTQGARFLKYITHNIDVIKQLNYHNIGFFASRSLMRDDKKYLHERVQSLKFARHIMELIYNSSNNNEFDKLFPQSLVQAIICISNDKKDEFRNICIDTLNELANKNIKIICSNNGINSIINCILDESLDDIQLRQSLLLTLITILDNPNKRKYLTKNLDLQQIFSPLCEMIEEIRYGVKPPQKEKEREIVIKVCYF